MTRSRACSRSSRTTSSSGAKTASIAPASSPPPRRGHERAALRASSEATRSSMPPGGPQAPSARRSCGRPTRSARTPKSSRIASRPRLTAPIAGWAIRVSRRACSCAGAALVVKSRPGIDPVGKASPPAEPASSLAKLRELLACGGTGRPGRAACRRTASPGRERATRAARERAGSQENPPSVAGLAASQDAGGWTVGTGRRR